MPGGGRYLRPAQPSSCPARTLARAGRRCNARAPYSDHPPSGGAWHSGIWAGGDTARTTRVKAFGSWRGTPTDAATQYPEVTTWQTIHDSHWHISTYAGFDGTLVYGLPMLPE